MLPSRILSLRTDQLTLSILRRPVINLAELREHRVSLALDASETDVLGTMAVRA